MWQVIRIIFINLFDTSNQSLLSQCNLFEIIIILKLCLLDSLESSIFTISLLHDVSLVLRYALGGLLNIFDEYLAVLEVDDCHDDSGRHHEIEQRDDHVHGRVYESIRWVVHCQVRSVVRRDHHQEGV